MVLTLLIHLVDFSHEALIVGIFLCDQMHSLPLNPLYLLVTQLWKEREDISMYWILITGLEILYFKIYILYIIYIIYIVKVGTQFPWGANCLYLEKEVPLYKLLDG